ncbi:hypothetical protein Taro_052684 [Colocasia esculenta]|uniref:BUB1 N-terminal domain-containing protein n=1 Tax=Colocasia esculenta TaxID=4460 RepID=A0A843XK13_COLES|nr:hypothetical protein [Colocasia esculenta]
MSSVSEDDRKHYSLSFSLSTSPPPLQASSIEDPMASLDPETSFLASESQTGNEWELFKENVRPLKRGRNVELLNEALRSQTDHTLKKSLIEKRRRLIEGIDEYEGDDPLKPWIECVKWVQESFPPGGECSGLVIIYEQCVRMFWHDERYKDDLRYLKVWLEYAENCADAEVIYSFLEANRIGQNHSVYYISYALHLESKHKMKKASEIFNLGITRKAKPVEKLEVLYRKFLARSAQRNRVTEDESTDGAAQARSFGTVLARGEIRKLLLDFFVNKACESTWLIVYYITGRQPVQKTELSKRKALQRFDTNTHLAIYNDADSRSRHQLDAVKNGDLQSWHALGTRLDRNKENTSLPSKWTSYKIPQKTGTSFRRTVPVSHLEVFVDDECTELPASESTESSDSALQLSHIESLNLKKTADDDAAPLYQSLALSNHNSTFRHCI